MRVFNSPLKNYLYLGYRLISPIIDPVRLYYGIVGYGWYARDYLKYKLKAPSEKILGINLFPILNEKVTVTPFDSHYFYQEIWAFNHIMKAKPKQHIDIASKYQFAGFVSSITKSIFVDIRPIETKWKNLSVVKGDVLNLPYKTNSVSSLSSLHVIEHIGLGRYGDPIDPTGTRKAAAEMVRVLKPGGKLYVSVPLGAYRICFNAHRVHPPQMILSYFSPLKLLEFSVVDDQGIMHEKTQYQSYANLHYGCGMFLFTK